MASVGDKDRVLELTRRFLAPHRVEVWVGLGTQLVVGRREEYRLWDLAGRERSTSISTVGRSTSDIATRKSSRRSFSPLGSSTSATTISPAWRAPSWLRARPADSGQPDVFGLLPERQRGQRRRDQDGASRDWPAKDGRARGRVPQTDGALRSGREDASARYFLSDSPTSPRCRSPTSMRWSGTRTGEVAAVLFETVPATSDSRSPRGATSGGCGRCATSTAPFSSPMKSRPALDAPVASGASSASASAGHPRDGKRALGRDVPDRGDGDE